VRIDGAPIDDADAELELDRLRGKVLSLGRKRFVRLV
jgi:hypothetical protein